MNFLQATQKRLAVTRKAEQGFTLAEMPVYMALLTILIAIICITVGGTLLPQLFTPTLAHADNLDLKPAQQATERIYNDIQTFTRENPDEAVSKSALVSGGYVNEAPDVVWAFHTYGGPANRQMCVIAYISDGTSSDYTASNPAAFDSLYQSGSIGQDCKRQVSGSNALVPNWDSE